MHSSIHPRPHSAQQRTRLDSRLSTAQGKQVGVVLGHGVPSVPDRMAMVCTPNSWASELWSPCTTTLRDSRPTSGRMSTWRPSKLYHPLRCVYLWHHESRTEGGGKVWCARTKPHASSPRVSDKAWEGVWGPWGGCTGEKEGWWYTRRPHHCTSKHTIGPVRLCDCVRLGMQRALVCKAQVQSLDPRSPNLT